MGELLARRSHTSALENRATPRRTGRNLGGLAVGQAAQPARRHWSRSHSLTRRCPPDGQQPEPAAPSAALNRAFKLPGDRPTIGHPERAPKPGPADSTARRFSRRPQFPLQRPHPLAGRATRSRMNAGLTVVLGSVDRRPLLTLVRMVGAHRDPALHREHQAVHLTSWRVAVRGEPGRRTMFFRTWSRPAGTTPPHKLGWLANVVDPRLRESSDIPLNTLSVLWKGTFPGPVQGGPFRRLVEFCDQRE